MFSRTNIWCIIREDTYLEVSSLNFFEKVDLHGRKTGHKNFCKKSS
jgi:hypothetical protein